MESSKISSEEISTVPNLEPDLINEILLCLPAKSLLKFKCVCKSWLSLISCPKFIKTHLNLSTKSTTHSDYSFILCSTRALANKYYTCSLSSILFNTAVEDSRVLDFPFCEPIDQLRFAGSCNGLLCVCINRSTLVLYNPCVRKFKTLLVSGTDFTVGFCYDELNDDYKVVQLSIVHSRPQVNVYSLRNDSWRRIDSEYDAFCFCGGGINVGGILHWLSYKDDRPSLARRQGSSLDPYLIFAVNIVTYTCDTMAQPPQKYDRGVGKAERGLFEVDGCLGAIHDYYKIRLDVWAMKEYGVKESWTMLFSIAYPGGLRDVHRSLRPLFVFQNGDIILDYGPYMMLYNSRDNSFTIREIRSTVGLCYVVSPAYIESLVTPSLIGE